jgi:hypothetical protein
MRLANPFPGLRPFQEEEEHLFFGRESQIDVMIDKLAVSRFLAVVGTSGSGKSSLVNCGLRPALRRGMMARAGSDWHVAQFRPGGEPVKSLACALAQPGVLFDNPDFAAASLSDMIEATLLMSKLGLVDMYEQSHVDRRPNLLLIVDQFEEIFRYKALQGSSPEASARNDKATALVNLLLDASQSAYPIYVVLTMRSDFLGDCSQFEGLPEAINRGEYLVPRMTREERKIAILGPVRVGGGDISPVLLTRLLNDVGDNPDQLSIMQHALNRTWARWQNEGDPASPMSLEHYEAIGTMANALDWHAEKAFHELDDDHARQICKKVFQSLTDRGTDARGVRRPTRLWELCAITEANEEEVIAILDIFRKPSRSFIMPPMPERLTADSVIDISHESLMRVWTRLRDWAQEEAASATQYTRLVENCNLHARGASGLMIDPELSVMLDWQRRWKPNAAWAKRYHPDFEGAMLFLQGSRMAREAQTLAEEHARKQQLRRTQAAAVVLAILLLLAIGAGIYAYVWRSNAQTAKAVARQEEQFAAQEHSLRNQAEDARAEAEQRRKEAEEARKQADDARALAEQAKQRAEEADARAERNAELFMSAMQAQAAAQRASAVELEKSANLQRDTEEHKSAESIAQDKRELESAKTNLQTVSSDAAQKTAAAFAIMGAARSIGTDQISRSDLFDISAGATTTGTSGARNPTDMFNGGQGSPTRATIFADGQPVGYLHWVEWRTRTDTTIKSVALYAAHDQIRFRRAFSNFKLYAKKQGQWTQLAEYNPALPYGGSCSKEPCIAPNINFKPGTVLSVCVNISKPIAAEEYRAEFAQAVTALEGFSGPRLLQLDGYANANCAK